MKVNVSKLYQDTFNTLVEYHEDRLPKPPKNFIDMDWLSFISRYDKLTTKLDMVMPESHQKGLIFKITVGIGETKKPDSTRSTWVTIQRGVKHWFITNITIDRPATIDIHPVNLTLAPESEETIGRLWSIIEKVTTPGWFNS